MPEFVLSRNYTLATLHGHVIEFKKGQPTYVAPICVREVVAIGAECVDGPVDVLDPEQAPEIAMSHDDRRGNIIAAFKLLEERQDREDFTSSGRPAQKVVVKILGFSVDSKELASLWDEYLAGKGAAE